MVKINTLYSLSNISDCYSIDDDCIIYNTITGHKKNQSLGKRGYYYVSLNEKNSNRQVKVPVHKIIALAFIKNDKYESINHIDGNKLNNNISNLEFCSQQYNVIHAWRTNLIKREEKIFKITKLDNTVVSGTIKELSNNLNIPKGTLYDLFYKSKSSKKYSIKSIEEI